VGHFLTSSSTLMCPHGGTVSAIPSNQRVTLGGDPIVLATDTFMVAGCAFAPGGAPHPCLQVEWQLTAQRSDCDGTSTLTLESVGMCKAGDGAVQGPVIIQATQTKAEGL
jgi:hypothetical protein